MRRITEQGRSIIKRFEGFSPVIYRCPGGYDTIGYGHLVRDWEKFSEPMSYDEADRLLIQDVGIAERAVLRLIDVELSDGQFDALVSFTFNLGAGALQRSTLRRQVNREAHAHVPIEFMKWVFAGGKKQRGLIRRRLAESMRYEG